MRNKTALLIILSMLMSFIPSAYSAESVAVSVGKPRWSIYYGDGGYNGKVVANANDGETSTYFHSYTGADEEDGLIIDLEAKYVIDYASVVFAGSVSSYEIQVSNNDDFSEYVTLVEQNGNYAVPQDKATQAFRYVKLYVPQSVTTFRVRELTVYSSSEPVGGNPQEFIEQLVPISVGKPIKSRLYGGDKGYSGYPTDANDGKEDTKFVATPTAEKPVEWLRIDLEEAAVISCVEILLASQTQILEISVFNDLTAGNVGEPTDRVLLEKGEDGLFRVPDEYKYTKFRMLEARKADDSRDSFQVKELTAYVSTKDMISNQAAGKPVITDGAYDFSSHLTDGAYATEKETKEALVDLLIPSYVRSVELFGTDKDDVQIKGSLFNTTPELMEEIQDGKKYRYILIEPTEETMILSEIDVNTYDTDYVSGWSRKGDDFSVTVINNSYDMLREYVLYAASFDESSSIISSKSQALTLEAGEKAEVKLTVPNSIYADRIACMIDNKNGSLHSAAYEFSKDGVRLISTEDTPYNSSYDKNLDLAVASEIFNDGVKLNVSEIAGLVPSDIIRVTIYDSNENVIFADASSASGGAAFEFYLPYNAEAGEYKVKIGITDALGVYSEKELSFQKSEPTNDAISEAITAFSGATVDTFPSVYQKYYVEDGTVSLGDVSELRDSDVLSKIGKSFSMAISGINLWKSDAASSLTVDDIHSAVEVAVIIDALEEERSNIVEALAKYSDNMDLIFDGTEDMEKLTSLYKKGAQTVDGILDNIKIAAALGAMKDESTENIVSALQKYSEILKVKLGTITQSNVDIYDVAKRLDKTIPGSYFDGLEVEILAILAELLPKNNDTGSIRPAGGGGNRGGGGGSVAIPIVKAPETEKTDNTLVFSDVAEKHWAYKSIKALTQKGILNGTGAGEFEPNRNVSRAEFVKMLVGAFSLTQIPEQKITFSDMSVNDWFYPYIDAAVSCNVVKGVSDSEFMPNETIRRQDAALMCSNLMTYKGVFKSPGKLLFSDAGNISEYASYAVSQLANIGVINGFEDNTFRPMDNLSRAQAAIIIDALMSVVN